MLSYFKIGTSGFSFEDWKGSVYPQHLKKEGIFYSCKEKELAIEDALKEVEHYPGFSDIIVERPDLDGLISQIIE